VALDAALLERVLTRALGAGDYADAFYERRVTRTFRLQDGRIHEAGIALSCGVGIRVLAGERAVTPVRKIFRNSPCSKRRASRP